MLAPQWRASCPNVITSYSIHYTKLYDGSSANISVRLGKRNFKEANEILKVSLTYMFFFGIIITVLGYLLLDYYVYLMDIPKNLADYVLTYSKVIIFGSIATILAYSLDVILRNDGFPKKSMYILISYNFV